MTAVRDALDALLMKRGGPWYDEFVAYNEALLSTYDTIPGDAAAVAADRAAVDADKAAVAADREAAETAKAAAEAAAASAIAAANPLEPSEIAGVPPVLDLLLTNAAGLPAGVFSRAGTATYFDAAGQMQTAAADEPRIDHDPVSGRCRGLLIEGERSNLLLNSATLSTQSVSVTAVEHTISFYGSGSITLSGAHSATVASVAPDRATLTFTPSAGSLTVTVTGSVTLAQLEAGGNASAYIPTTGSPVTRAADVLTLDTAEWLAAGQGTLVIKSERVATTTVQVGAWLGEAEAADRIILSSNGGGVFAGGAGQAQFLAASVTPGTLVRMRQALAWATNDFAYSEDGGAAVTDSSGTVPDTPTLFLGNSSLSAVVAPLNGWLRRVTVFPRRLNDATLQLLTED